MQLKIMIRCEPQEPSGKRLTQFRVTEDDVIRFSWLAADWLILKINGEPHEFMDVIDFDIRKSLDA